MEKYTNSHYIFQRNSKSFELDSQIMAQMNPGHLVPELPPNVMLNLCSICQLGPEQSPVGKAEEFLVCKDCQKACK